MKINDFSKWKLFSIWYKATKIRTTTKIIDPFYIAKEYNIDVSFIDMDEPYAFNQYNPLSRRYTIYISNAVDKYSAKILCAHELGHIFCEKPQAVNLFDHKIDPVSEFTANCFASFLVPFDARFTLKDDTTIEDYNDFVASLILKKQQALREATV